jgi:catechol 2,3-dioxygenase-like lactoylglutathione lyase family enzyme
MLHPAALSHQRSAARCNLAASLGDRGPANAWRMQSVGPPILKHISAVSIVVPDYDEAIAFYVGVLGFVLIEDTVLTATKRWVLVAPTPNAETRLLLAKAADDAQRAAIGNQTGGRVLLFVDTTDFWADYAALRRRTVTFLGEPRREAYGTVVVFQDPFGNKWDLVERPKKRHPG